MCILLTKSEERRKRNEVPSTQLVDDISLIWQWWETKGSFLIWRVVLPYLDTIGKKRA